MTYVDGFVLAVPADKKDAFREHASGLLPFFKQAGVTRVVESWGDDVPDGKVTDYKGAVKATSDEKIVYSWIEWPSKQARDAAWPKIMQDGRMKPDHANMPFDGKRMIYGGFTPIVDA
jgi:uncharacterized protein YbaA (DUF1428 family)